MSDLIRVVEQTIMSHHLFEPRERIIVAVSGGPDSVALLHVLSVLSIESEWSLSVLHVNHGLRGEESDTEERYVADLCKRLNVPYEIAHVDVAGQLCHYGNNVQSAARALRYNALREAAARFGASAIAVGHHGDDQAETVLMRLLRGTSPGGLAGIRMSAPYKGARLVRPFLGLTRAEIEAYCKQAQLEPRHDSSNDLRKYFRNVVRLDILPYLKQYRPAVSDSLRRLAEASAEESDYLDGIAASLLQGSIRRDAGRISANRRLFLETHLALQRRMIKIILNSLEMDEAAVDFMKIERIRQAIASDAPSSTRLRLGAKLWFRRTYETVEWIADSECNETAEPYEVVLDIESDGSIVLDPANASLMWTKEAYRGDSVARWRKDADVEAFDADALGGRLIVRSRRPGDRIEPFGLNGSKKVKDMFIDAKLPGWSRDSWPIVTDLSGRVLWIPGFRRSRFAPVHELTRKVLVMEKRDLGDILE